MMDKLTVFGHITKVDLVKRTVEGVAMDETPDRDGEIYDYDSSKQYVQNWANTQAENTKAAGQEVSYGNLRAQHDSKIVAGAIRSLTFDDKSKSVPIVAKVVDDKEWEKCVEGAYTGFSVRGKQIGKKWRDGAYMRYTVDPIEISMVDLPCNPGATFTVIKSDGATEERQFHISESDEEIEKRTFSERRRKDLASSGKALPDGSFPIVNREDLENAVRAIGRAKDPDAAKKHIKARAKELGAEDVLPDDWKEKAALEAEIEKLRADVAELQKRTSPAADRREHAMTPQEIQKAAEIKKAAAIEKMKAARKAHDQVSACLGGYCDHDGPEKCMEKCAEAHNAIKGAFEDKEDGGDDEAEKAAKLKKAADAKAAADQAETEKAAQRAEIVKKAKELGIELVEPAKAVDPEVEELKKSVAALKEQIEKAAPAQRNKPVLNGKVISKADETPNPEEVKKFNDVKKDDPNVVAKAISAIRSTEPELVD